MIPFSLGNSFEILKPSPDKLIVLCPLYWVVALIAALSLGLPGLRKVLQGFRNQNMRSFIWGLIFIGLGAAATTLIGRGRVTFNKAAQTATFETVGFLFIPRIHVAPLNEVSHATVQTTAGASMFVVVFRGGARRSLSGYTSQRGQFEAAYAVNEFLGVPQDR